MENGQGMFLLAQAPDERDGSEQRCCGMNATITYQVGKKCTCLVVWMNEIEMFVTNEQGPAGPAGPGRSGTARREARSLGGFSRLGGCRLRAARAAEQLP